MNHKKIALVTGASAGIGKETAQQLIQDGFVVYAAARRLAKMEDLKRLGAILVAMDIAVEADIQRVVQLIQADEGRIDVLVNNAGYAVYGAVEDTPVDEGRQQFEVNLFGLARVTQLVIPIMRAQQSGKIINVSSVGGKIYSPLGAWYHASKHALEGWSDCLRLELHSFGIDVVVIEPGGIKTEFVDIMSAPMMERSGNTDYQTLAKKMEKSGRDMWEKNKMSPPAVIAKVISTAARAKRPKTRYAAGYMAKATLTLRKWLSDRQFDRVISNSL